ncbi:AAA family ATPase [Microbulbifer marinus]|uniref:ATP-dependent exoDNAse (Exonuclease V), alpha subunit, helicase superfamily I n=1 Tax=Microbulbifer marinus TaxID=658218 RepID=A0A1H3ZA98_9GAMM|nr:AAA family ATPase [Microbulbifer marinus]SEA20689.1 ATP-dependent exoDNAse (exonuclease V), alpha subunit, helicase superfamily I [Microbulbifer marinus]
MANHLTLRLAWHNDGWNGRICQNPAKNTYCVGCSSYPGELVREQRDLKWEKKHAGKKFSELEQPPACMYSGSAFSEEANQIKADPPDFFNDDTKTKYWENPPATACTWPYEAMYNRDDVKVGNRYDYDKRLAYAEEHFESVEANKSLVFYYANYSNPLSDDEEQRYLLVGVARIKNVMPTIYYEGCSERVLERYKGFIWQRGISSYYPEQGVRLPYHRYLDKPSVLQQFAAYPENSSLCKYATKQVSDDEALGLLEQLLESVRIVRDDLHDDSENWDQRIHWLESLIAELWRSRGAYPGMPAALNLLGLEEAISEFKQEVEAGREAEAVKEIIAFCRGEQDHIVGFVPFTEELEEIRRYIDIEVAGKLDILISKLARIELTSEQMLAILSEGRSNNGLRVSLNEIAENPYLISEQYRGIDQHDVIRWSKVDRGMLPLPNLSADPLFKKNSKERLRALLLETIRGFHQQTFISDSTLIERVNKRILVQPEWKQNLVTERYLEVDKPFYDGAIVQKNEGGVNYLYDANVWEDECLIRESLSKLLNAPDISLKRPLGDSFWTSCLYREQSNLARSAPEEYKAAVDTQRVACEAVISKRLCAITGGAGTGKSTVVAALIRAVRKAHGEGANVAVLAPTGKATDRLRSALHESGVDGVKTLTIHSLLASHGWLHDNMAFKREGGKRIDLYSTLIIDESSMIDLSLMATLFRAIDWNTVSRLILVGDAAQLPPIGIGKVYADIVSYLRDKYEDHLVELTENLRQLENRVGGQGCGILELANLFINPYVRPLGSIDEKSDSDREKLIQKVHEGGSVDKDLRVVYWQDEESLSEVLIKQIVQDVTCDDNLDKSEAKRLGDLLNNNINALQILSPVRGELYGTQHINTRFQSFKSEYWISRGLIDNIAMFDKVIQTRNIQKSNPLKAFNFETRKVDNIQVFNGEIGRVVPTGNWTQFFKDSKWSGFRLKNFSVKFSGKDNLSVNYCTNSNSKPEGNLELAYAISVHKAQGSEFDRVYFVLPESSHSACMELIYTALTRAKYHCTLFVQGGVDSLINNSRPEMSALKMINSSLFEFQPVNDLLANKPHWYEAGKLHESLTGDMVRSKSEVIIANILHERKIPFWYEKPLVAPDGTMYLPDFTIQFGGETYFWEHLGMLSNSSYKEHWEEKQRWYDANFPGQLLITEERPDLSKAVTDIIEKLG